MGVNYQKNSVHLFQEKEKQYEMFVLLMIIMVQKYYIIHMIDRGEWGNNLGLLWTIETKKDL